MFIQSPHVVAYGVLCGVVISELPYGAILTVLTVFLDKNIDYPMQGKLFRLIILQIQAQTIAGLAAAS